MKYIVFKMKNMQLIISLPLVTESVLNMHDINRCFTLYVRANKEYGNKQPTKLILGEWEYEQMTYLAWEGEGASEWEKGIKNKRFVRPPLLDIPIEVLDVENHFEIV